MRWSRFSEYTIRLLTRQVDVLWNRCTYGCTCAGNDLRSGLEVHEVKLDDELMTTLHEVVIESTD